MTNGTRVSSPVSSRRRMSSPPVSSAGALASAAGAGLTSGLASFLSSLNRWQASHPPFYEKAKRSTPATSWTLPEPRSTRAIPGLG
ncbi:MAG: hypothetical protein R6X21_02730, partial [Candidatus Aminicenantes bacterium]